MIVAPSGGRLRIVRQVDHQEQCGLLMTVWGNSAFGRPDPWECLVDAAARHDEGWRTWEQRPQVLPDGSPQGFDQMDVADHVAIHRASAAAAKDAGDGVALLVGMHGSGLLMRRLGLDGGMPPLADRPAPAREFVHDQARDARVRRLRLGEGPGLGSWAWSAYRLIQAVDLLSLYLTWRGLAGRESWSLRRVPRAPGDEQGVDIAVTAVDEVSCTLNPWPFGDDVVEAPVKARLIDDRPYADADGLTRALDDAPLQVLPMRVVRTEPGPARS